MSEARVNPAANAAAALAGAGGHAGAAGLASAAGLAGNGGSEAAPALQVEAVAHRFGARQALADVSLSVPRGRFVALLGPNGAGKTTLFAIVTRLYHNRSGTVRIFGHDLHRRSSLALAELGVVFQSRTLDADLTVRQNLAYHAALHGLSGRATRQRIESLVARAGLAERIDDKVRTLSGGQARRVEIARALVHAPRLLLLDEATVGLDLASRADIVTLVRALVAEAGLAVLWATHIFDEIEPADEVYVLHQGRIVAAGLASDIAARSGAGPGAGAAPGAVPGSGSAAGSLAAAFRALTDAAPEGKVA